MRSRNVTRVTIARGWVAFARSLPCQCRGSPRPTVSWNWLEFVDWRGWLRPIVVKSSNKRPEGTDILLDIDQSVGYLRVLHDATLAYAPERILGAR